MSQVMYNWMTGRVEKMSSQERHHSEGDCLWGDDVRREYSRIWRESLRSREGKGKLSLSPFSLLDLKRFLQNYQFQATMVNSAPDAQRKTLRQDFVNPQDGQQNLWPVFGIRNGKMFDLSLVCKDCQTSHWGRKGMLGGHTRDWLSSDSKMDGKASRDKLTQLYKCTILRVYKAATAAQKADIWQTHVCWHEAPTLLSKEHITIIHRVPA